MPPRGDTTQPDWLSPFSLELGEFACPVDVAGCESDDNPQRALATFSDGASSVDVLDGTSAQLGLHTLLLTSAREPDYCEGQPTSAKLGGLIIRTP